MKNVKPKKKRKIKYFRIFLALSIFVFLVFMFLKMPIFNVRNVLIEGNSKVETDDILKLSKIGDNTNIFFLDKEKIENNILENRYIESASISRKFPKDIHIEIVERKPAAIVPSMKDYLLVDRYGYIIEKSKNLSLNLCTIKGINQLQEVNLGEKIFNYASDKQNEFLNKLFDGENILKFKSVSLEKEKAEIILKNDILVGFGSYNDVDYKLKVLDRFESRWEKEGKQDIEMILFEIAPDPVLVLKQNEKPL